MNTERKIVFFDVDGTIYEMNRGNAGQHAGGPGKAEGAGTYPHPVHRKAQGVHVSGGSGSEFSGNDLRSGNIY